MKVKVVAICACIAGVAHTYMAAANLKKFAKQKDAAIKIETQGAMGIENRLSQKDIDEADVVIFAVDTNVADRTRFDGKNIFEVPTTEVVKHGNEVMEKALQTIK